MEENFVQRMTITAKQIEAEKKDQDKNRILLDEEFPLNQKLCLLEALIKQNNFVDFLKGYKALENCLDLSMHSGLLNSITEFIEWFLEPNYRHLSPSFLSKRKIKLHPFPTEDKYADKEFRRIEVDSKDIFSTEENAEGFYGFLTNLKSLLSLVVGYMDKKPTLYTKVCRILM